jgi:hypothetical protein
MSNQLSQTHGTLHAHFNAQVSKKNVKMRELSDFLDWRRKHFIEAKLEENTFYRPLQDAAQQCWTPAPLKSMKALIKIWKDLRLIKVTDKPLYRDR